VDRQHVDGSVLVGAHNYAVNENSEVNQTSEFYRSIFVLGETIEHAKIIPLIRIRRSLRTLQKDKLLLAGSR
jgi:hypothetical protein